MKTITIVSKDRVGLLADISYILSKSNINLDGLYADVIGDNAIISIETKDLQKSMQILETNGFKVIPPESLVVKVPNSETNHLTELLKEKKIEIADLSEISSDLKEQVFVLNVDKPRKASRLLNPFLFSNSCYVGSRSLS